MKFKQISKGLIDKIEEWDYKVFLSFYNNDFLKNRRIKTLAKIFSFFGNMYFWFLVWLFMGAYGYFTKEYYLFLLITGGFIQSMMLHVLIRYLVVKRNRPYITLEKNGVKQHDELIRESKSFPSGHVAFLLFFGIIFAFYFKEIFWIILLTFIGLDVIMAITRLILGVHFPSDCLFGFFFGFIYALLFLYCTCPYWVAFFNLLVELFFPIIYFWR